MNVYAPPEAGLEMSAGAASLSRRLGIFVVLAVGGVLTSAIAFLLCGHIPPIGHSRELVIGFFVGRATLAAIGGAVPWWHVLARVYKGRALIAGAVIGALPASLRMVGMSQWPTDTWGQITTMIDTVGLIAAFSIGAAVVHRRLGANNSSKPTPLRGAA